RLASTSPMDALFFQRRIKSAVKKWLCSATACGGAGSALIRILSARALLSTAKDTWLLVLRLAVFSLAAKPAASASFGRRLLLRETSCNPAGGGMSFSV